MCRVEVESGAELCCLHVMYLLSVHALLSVKLLFFGEHGHVANLNRLREDGKATRMGKIGYQLSRLFFSGLASAPT